MNERSVLDSPPAAVSSANSSASMEVSLLTGGFDRPYAFGLSTALANAGISVKMLGNDAVDLPELHTVANIKFMYVYWRTLQGMSAAAKFQEVLATYGRLLRHAAQSRSGLFHILWNNKFPTFDRTLLLLYYKMLGIKTAFTAHNVNAGQRDGNDSMWNRLTLRIQYGLNDHIFVHTRKMKQELIEDFGVASDKVTVIPFGINNSVPDTELTRAEARERLGIGAEERTILFFGNIRPYKGLEYLVDAFNLLPAGGYRLVIAGQTKKDSAEYMAAIQASIDKAGTGSYITQHLVYVSDADTEIYFKAADVCVLPYTLVFQSGVLSLSYSFALPVIASDVGSLAEDIEAGRTGFTCKPRDAADLARVLREYFESPLYNELEERRQEIRDYANSRYSWQLVGEMTKEVYRRLQRA